MFSLVAFRPYLCGWHVNRKETSELLAQATKAAAATAASSPTPATPAQGYTIGVISAPGPAGASADGARPSVLTRSLQKKADKAHEVPASASVAAQRFSIPQLKEFRRIFDQHDTDHSGGLEIHEMPALLQSVGLHSEVSCWGCRRRSRFPALLLGSSSSRLR